MKKIDKAAILRTGLSLGATAALGIALGCGEIGGAGQCSGVDVTGMCVTVDSIQPNYFGENTHAVDAFQTIDCDPTTPELDTEPMSEHLAVVSFSATLMSGVTVPPAPAYVEWEGYSVQYVPNPNNLGANPPLTGFGFSESIKVDAGSTLTTTLDLVPIQTKAEYGSLGGDTLPMAYTAFFTFTGRTQFNQQVVLLGSTTFDIGDWDNCP